MPVKIGTIRARAIVGNVGEKQQPNVMNRAEQTKLTMMMMMMIQIVV